MTSKVIAYVVRSKHYDQNGIRYGAAVRVGNQGYGHRHDPALFELWNFPDEVALDHEIDVYLEDYPGVEVLEFEEYVAHCQEQLEAKHEKAR